MKIAFLYSGQGSQYVGMGREFYDYYSSFRDTLDCCSLKINLKEICFEDPNGLLDKTEYTQPCIVAYQVAVTNVLFQHGIHPQYTLGVSLGEYSALYAADVWDAETVLDIVSYRGKTMEECVKDMSCLTASIIGLSNECMEELCKECSKYGIVQITNYCCSGNVSIGGEKEAVEKAMNLAKKEGAKYCIPLKSCYPFHTGLLSEAGEKIYEYIKKVDMREMTSTVVFNYVGRKRKDDETIEGLLRMQIQNPIQLEKSIHFLEKENIDMIIDLGPGDTNSRLVRRISPTMKCISIKQPSDLECLFNILTV